jgi:hypothetical protein
MPSDIQDMGFGLNYNQGFRPMSAGGGGGRLGGGADPNDPSWFYKFGQQSALERQLAGMQQAGETQRAQISAAASRYPSTLKQQRFNQVSPWLQGQYNTPVDIGQSQAGPAIDASPIWGEGQIQGRVNAMRGANDAATAGKMRGMQQQVAGRGFGSNSPLAQALGAGMQASNLATNTQGENDLRWQAAQGNKQFVLQAQQAQEQEAADRNQEDIQRRQMQAQRQNAIIAAMAGIV